MGVVEKAYGNLFRFTLMVANPFKKAVIKTQCKVHMFINFQALVILYNDGYEDAYDLFSDYIYEINRGAVWADQDFKSTSHFYSPLKNKGMYGHRNALNIAEEYYKKAIDYWRSNDDLKAMFYLGAAAHLVQDMTVPQHANIRLMDNHKQYETFVKKTYKEVEIFKATEGSIRMSTVEDFIRYNAKISIKLYKKFHCVKKDDERYYRITKHALPLAEKTTAGFFLMFYRDIASQRSSDRYKIRTG